MEIAGVDRAFIWLAQERGLGIAALEGIEQVGCPLAEVKRSFARLGKGFRPVATQR